MDLIKCQLFDFFYNEKTLLMLPIAVFHIFHECGGVHWDISISNLYLYEGCGMLDDLEFAKNTDDDSQHEVQMVSGMYFLSAATST